MVRVGDNVQVSCSVWVPLDEESLRASSAEARGAAKVLSCDVSLYNSETPDQFSCYPATGAAELAIVLCNIWHNANFGNGIEGLYSCCKASVALETSAWYI